MFIVSFGAIIKSNSSIRKQYPNYKGKLQVVYLGLLIVISIVTLGGFAKKSPMPVVPLLFASMLLFAVWFAYSKFGRALGNLISIPTLVGFQGFRVFLEFLLHHWSLIGTIPETMTWTGQNFDILSGVLAIVFIPIVIKGPRLAWIPSLIGFLLLLNVLRVVVMSSPFPFSWPLENPLQLAMYWPYVLIGPLFVMPALVGHLILFRVLTSDLPPETNQ
jgi:hypothetical protein